MKVPLSTRTKFVNVIVGLRDKPYDKIKSALAKDIEVYCRNYCDLYAYILHDRDINEEGIKSYNHFHLVMIMKTARQRLSTILNDLSSYLGVNPLAIQIEKCNDINGSIQYLIHKYQPNKFQYSINEINTNLTDNELSLYLSSESGALSIDKLIEIVNNSVSLLDVMKSLGLGYYHLYWREIEVIARNLHKTFSDYNPHI